MKYKHFYVPNTPATLCYLVSASIPIAQARFMLGQTFEIQYVNPIAEPAIAGTPWINYAWEGAAVENVPKGYVDSWTVPLSAVELKP